jgi:predicted GH43/DUF377 family glycosyl hydrolase
LFWGAGVVHAATTDDLITFSTVNDTFLAPRPGSFDDKLVESGPPPMALSDGNYVFFFNTMNSTDCYAPSWAVLSGSDPLVVLQRSDSPILVPQRDWEIGAAPAQCNVGCVVFVEGAAWVGPSAAGGDLFDLFFGGADAVVGTVRVEVASTSTSQSAITSSSLQQNHF